MIFFIHAFLSVICIPISLYCVLAQDTKIFSARDIILTTPQLEVKNFETGDVINTWRYANESGDPVLISVSKDELLLLCEAPFPIRWNITGYIDDPDFLVIRHSKNEIVKVEANGELGLKYRLQLHVFFSEFEARSAASAQFFCAHPQNPNINTSLKVFMKKAHPLVHHGQNLTVKDSTIIPCPTTDPDLPIELILMDGPEKHYIPPTEHPLYDPLVGYNFQQIIEGQFNCTTENSSMVINATATHSPVPGFNFAPKSRFVKAFKDESISVQCSKFYNGSAAELPDFDIVVDNSTFLILNRTIEVDEKNNFVQIIVNIRASTKFKSKASLINVTAVCSTLSREVWTWDIEFVEPPEMRLNNYFGTVDCASDYPDREISTVRCRNPSHCDYMKNCFADPESCNYRQRKQFHSNEATRCLGYFCATLFYNFLNGVVQCKVRGLARHFHFFASLESLRRSSWVPLRASELVQMDDTEPIMYTNLTSVFVCRALGFHFLDSLQFSIEFRNGSKMFLLRSIYNITEYNESSPRIIEELNVMADLKINLPIEAVAVHCHAPWWNSTDFYTTAKYFETRYLLRPEARTEKNQRNVRFVKGSFRTHGRQQRLNCSVVGEPKPTYSWLHNGRPIKMSDEYFQVTTGPHGESLLEFRDVNDDLEGGYTCNADNAIGNASVAFRVEVFESEEEASLSNKTYGAVIGIVLFILFGVVIILGYVVSRYLKAKALLRGLTENEIDEFFKGRPELISGALKADNLEFMAYENKYEVELDDIEFDSAQVLGSGEFSVVVKGRIISRDVPAAVKIAKPSADVTLFKTLLSEVKIMIFIGKHENIVALLGVCTRDIRNRNIHVLLEICDNGSLEKYLRKGRQNFINVIDQNTQELNLQILRSHPDASLRLNTMDLIRWALEIARGMEYLSYKGIVHADLAARNVLLDKNKVCKVSDFGLSKKLYECTNYVKKTKSPLPWRWMSLEALTTLAFSKESDVWSYGVTLWEIFTLGDTPFPSDNWDKEFIQRLTSGMRMGKPRFATLEIYSQIVNCWDADPLLRPEFSKLRQYFTGLGGHGHGDYKNLQGQPELYDAGTDVTSVTMSDVGSANEDYKFRNPNDLYLNIDPAGGPVYLNHALSNSTPMYSNYDPSVTPMYSNMPSY